MIQPTVAIAPTVGRIVWFRPVQPDSFCLEKSEPLAAIITRVWNDVCVNITVFGATGIMGSRKNITLVPDETAVVPPTSYCEWMPYQLGQAARTEAAEAVAASEGPLVAPPVETGPETSRPNPRDDAYTSSQQAQQTF